MIALALWIAFLLGTLAGLLLGKWLPQTINIRLHVMPELPDDPADKWKGGK